MTRLLPVLSDLIRTKSFWSISQYQSRRTQVSHIHLYSGSRLQETKAKPFFQTLPEQRPRLGQCLGGSLIYMWSLYLCISIAMTRSCIICVFVYICIFLFLYLYCIHDQELDDVWEGPSYVWCLLAPVPTHLWNNGGWGVSGMSAVLGHGPPCYQTPSNNRPHRLWIVPIT